MVQPLRQPLHRAKRAAAASGIHPKCASSVSRPGNRFLALVPKPCRMAGRINSGSISMAWYILSPGSTRMVTSPGRRPPDRKLRRKAPDTDRVAFQAKCNELRLLAAEAERANPVSFAIGNSWNDTLRTDKQHYLEYTTAKIQQDLITTTSIVRLRRIGSA